MSKGRWTVSCLLCKKKGTGAVIQCDYKKCARSVHPICMFMMPNEFHLAPDERLIFCKEHTPSSDLKPELSSSRNKKIGSSTPSAKGGKSVSSSSVHDKKKSNSAGKQSASKPHSTDEKQHTASELLHEQHSTLTIDDVNITISKINLYITDKDLVRLLFSECLIHAFASGNYRESSSIAEKTDWAIEHLLKRNEITILRTLHEYNLIDLRAHVNTSRPTLLYLAVEYDQYECCEMLLDFGVDINAYSADEGPLNSALHSAAKFGFLNILNLLCVRGANINILNHHHETPLIIACRQGHIDCVQCLLQHNANVTQKTKSGNDVFQIATRGQNSEILKLIIAASPFDFLTSSNDDNNNTNVRSPGYHDKSVRVGATSNSGRKTSSHVMSAGSSNLSSSSSSSSSSAKNDHHQQQAGKRLKY